MSSCQQQFIDLINGMGIGDVDNHGTDKISVHSYDRVYGPVLNGFVNKTGALLEIGQRFGASTLLFRELLPNFTIEGIDNEPDNFYKPYREKLYNTSLIAGDAYTTEAVERFKQIRPAGYDIIIDDGPHTLESQIFAIEQYAELLKPGGVLVIEDIESVENLHALIKYIRVGYAFEYFDLRSVKNRYDDIALVVRKKKTTREAKIVMVAMFKNEAPVLRRMLDSTLGYCDYYVMQNNGSTDGSDEIAKQFLADNNLLGEVYICEQGWKGFGWNRDHLIQYCQAQDHGCDWILKMDCDEVLEVDEDFDWSPLDDLSIHAFHIPAVSGSTIYYRAWMWNARMHWSFRHDPAHEVIYCTDNGIGENFQRYNLPDKIRQVGFNEGQSWAVPTKFVSDSLILEEKLIREQTMLTDPYHFWYIGKSYADAWPCDSFPLGAAQKKEFARRTIFYFQQYNEYMHPNGPTENTVDELAYFGDVLTGYAYQYLQEYDQADFYWWNASRWVSNFNRSERILALAEMYESLGDYECAQLYTSKLIDPNNKCPFPHMMSFVDRNAYSDTSDYPIQLHNRVTQNTKPNIFKVRV